MTSVFASNANETLGMQLTHYFRPWPIGRYPKEIKKFFPNKLGIRQASKSGNGGNLLHT